MAVENANKITATINGISLFNIGLNVYGQLRRKKKVSVWTMPTPTTPAREVLVGSVINKQNRIGQEVAETLSRSTVILSCQVDKPSRLCKHPVESGVTITDHKIIDPVKCTISIAMPAYYQDIVIKELAEYRLKSTPLSVHDVSGIYNNMVVTNYPHTTDKKTADRLVFNVELEQIIVVDAQYVTLSKEQVANAKDASTVKRGLKQPQTNSSILNDILSSSIWQNAKNYVVNFFNGGI